MPIEAARHLHLKHAAFSQEGNAKILFSRVGDRCVTHQMKITSHRPTHTSAISSWSLDPPQEVRGAKMAHTRQSRPDYDPGVQVKFLYKIKVFPLFSEAVFHSQSPLPNQSLRRGRQEPISPQGSGFHKWKQAQVPVLNEFTPPNTLAWSVSRSPHILSATRHRANTYRSLWCGVWGPWFRVEVRV